MMRVGSACLCAMALMARGPGLAASAQPPRPAAGRTGTITGRVTFVGRPPGNPIIRMGMDPVCAGMNRGRMAIQEQAVVARDGSVANVFVRIEGTFAPTPVPAAPVVIDQRSCIYTPRVVGVRVGQRLQIRNADSLLHNVHSSSAAGNSFNVGQPVAGATFDFTPRSPEVMLKLGCDVHRWMVAFVGVMPHPYFDVTGSTGRYTIAAVPPGTYTIRTWHEQFGERAQQVTVRSGAAATIDTTPTAFAAIGVSSPGPSGTVRAPTHVSKTAAFSPASARLPTLYHHATLWAYCSGWPIRKTSPVARFMPKPAIANGIRSRAAPTGMRRKKPMSRRSKKPTIPMTSARPMK
jgi:plastocyanin